MEVTKEVKFLLNLDNLERLFIPPRVEERAFSDRTSEFQANID